MTRRNYGVYPPELDVKSIRAFGITPKDGKLPQLSVGLITLLKEHHYVLLCVLDDGKNEGRYALRDKFERVNIYDVEFDAKEGLVAIVSEPEYNKLVNPATDTPVVPKSLAGLMKDICEYNISLKQIGAQG